MWLGDLWYRKMRVADSAIGQAEHGVWKTGKQWQASKKHRSVRMKNQH